MKRALIFVSRCQNLKSEFNMLPWAGKINDGSFIYSAAGGGQTKTSDEPNAPLTGYGSMTYAGIKSLIYCGVPKNDPRIEKAYEWIQTAHANRDGAWFPIASYEEDDAFELRSYESKLRALAELEP